MLVSWNVRRVYIDVPGITNNIMFCIGSRDKQFQKTMQYGSSYLLDDVDLKKHSGHWDCNCETIGPFKRRSGAFIFVKGIKELKATYLH